MLQKKQQKYTLLQENNKISRNRKATKSLFFLRKLANVNLLHLVQVSRTKSSRCASIGHKVLLKRHQPLPVYQFHFHKDLQKRAIPPFLGPPRDQHDKPTEPD